MIQWKRAIAAMLTLAMTLTFVQTSAFALSTEAGQAFTAKFENTDRYLYRVGNGNTVTLGQLFTLARDFDAANINVSGSVGVTVVAADDSLTVGGDYSANDSDWRNGTIQFTGTGPVRVKIKVNGDGAQEYTLNLEVVNAQNVTAATDAKSYNVVLLNDVSGCSGFAVKNGYTLFGNGFSISMANTVSGSSITGIVLLENGTLDNVRLIGEVYPQANVYQSNNTKYLKNTVMMSGTSTISNSYISNSRAAVKISGGDATIIDTFVEGGAYTNIEISGAQSVTLHNVTTKQSPTNATVDDTSKQVVGAGIILNANPDIYITGTFKQYNWVTKSQAESYLPSTVSSLVKKIFDADTYSAYRHTYENETYVNTGIIHVVEQWEDNKMHDSHTNPVSYLQNEADMTVLGTTYHGSVYSVSSGTTLTEDLYTADEYAVTGNGRYKPVFTYTGEDSKFKIRSSDDPTEYKFTGSSIYNGADAGTISLSQYNSTGSFSINPRTGVSIVKYGTSEIPFTVKYDGESVGENETVSVDVTKNESHTLTYSITDTKFYDQNGDSVDDEAAYSWTVTIAVEPLSQSIPKPVFTVSDGDINESYYVAYAPSGDTDYVEAIALYSGVKVKYSYQDSSGTIQEIEKDFTSITQKPDEYGKSSDKAIKLSTAGQIDYLETTFADGSKLRIGIPYHHVSSKKNSQDDYFCVNYSSKIYIYSDPSQEGNRRDNGEDSELTLKYTFLDPLGQETENTLSMKHIWKSSTASVQWKKFDSNNGKKDGCFASGTLITLADGTQKPIEQVRTTDMLRTYDFFTGEYKEQPIALIINHGDDMYPITNLHYSDGTTLRLIYDHGTFDYDLNQFVYIMPDNYEEYVGHKFAKDDGMGGYTLVTLDSVEFTEEYTGLWSITSVSAMNAILDGVLTVAPPEEFYNWIEMGDKLRYDMDVFAADLATYGTYDYEVFADYVTYEEYLAFNGPYLRIPVEKGCFEFQFILDLIDEYKSYMTVNEIETVDPAPADAAPEEETNEPPADPVEVSGSEE